jgi:cell division protease FtsH
MNDKTKSSGTYNNYQQPGGFRPFWKYIFFFFLFWFALSYLSRFFTENRIEIPYTKFKEQVRQENIEEIVIKGSEITGNFKSAYISEQDSVEYHKFSSVKPAIEDKELLTLLERHNVSVIGETQDSNWLWYILILFVPWLLIIGYFMLIRKKMQGNMKNMMGGGGLFGIGQSRAKKYKQTDTSITFDDVAGLTNQKKDLQEIIDYLKDPEKYKKIGADVPKGILLMGPPGTGKTLLARATAGEAGVPFYSISGSEFIEMFVGVGASRVRDLFENAKKQAPAIIFIDEVDSVGRARGTGLGGGHDEREQTLNQILSEMDGFEPNQSVVVIAATNRPDVLDSALTRPGRFDRQITLDLPQKNARLKILEIHSENIPLADDVDLENLAARTISFSGAEIRNLVNEAALLAGRKSKSKVDMEDFEEARDKILLGAERDEKISEEEQKLVAYHEAGHALLAKYLPDTDPLQKVTIIPRGRALGVTEQIPEEDRHNLKRKYLFNRIAVSLGGRAAEKIIFNDISNGAANDLKMVTNLARKMVCQWGMSDKLGPVYFSKGEEHMFLGKEISQPKDFSESTATIIDEEVQSIVSDMEKKAEDTLKEHKTELNALAQALIENETMERDEIDWLLEKVRKGENGKDKSDNK